MMDGSKPEPIVVSEGPGGGGRQADACGESLRLADSLKKRTRGLHSKAERSGIVADILHGTANRHGYALLMRNLHPVYVALESALEAAKEDEELAGLAQPAVYRSASIDDDLAVLWGAGWQSALPLLPAAERYAGRIEALAKGDRTCIYGHAYTRYLGDLNGGQMLRRLLARRMKLDSNCLSFYDFPHIANLELFRTSYREVINRAQLSPARFHAAVEEGARAFVYNIELSLAIRAVVDEARRGSFPTNPQST